MEEPFLDLTTYTDGITAGWKTGDVYRLIIREAPRLFHASNREQQRRILRRRPPLTGTPWDAFLAATVEHVAVLHGHRPPERQVAKALRIGAQRADAAGFQYIVTMNSDSVPAEGFTDGFDVRDHFVETRLTDATETGGLFGIRFN